MADLILREWQGKTIRQREDGYICLTDMASATGKRFADWYRLKQTEEFLVVLSKKTGFSIANPETIETIRGGNSTPRTNENQQNCLIDIKQGLNTEKQGSYGHRKVALAFATWCSPEFFVQVIEWVEELLTTGLAVNTAKFNQEELDQLKSVVTNRNLRIRVLESQKKELEEQNSVLTQEHCYKYLVEAFVADNLMYKRGSYEHSNAVYDRFRLWKDEYADQTIYSQLPALTKLTFLQELQRYFKGLGTPKDHRMHISPLPEHTDIENAKLVEEYQIGMGTLTVGTQLGE